MATKKISELEAITEADGSDVLAIVDVSEGKTNKITKNNLLKGSGHTIEMSLNENYQIVLKLKNAEGTELSTATIDLPNENAITNISYSNGTLTLTKQSGVTSTVDISGLINGLATETALTNLANALKETIGIDTNTYNESQTYNTGDIVIQNEKIYKCIEDEVTGTFDSSKWDEISLYEYQKIQDEQTAENYKEITKLQEDVEDLTERVEDAENNELTYTPEISTSHYLQDSADSRFRKFIPIGRTTQESTTGKNLYKIIGQTNRGITGLLEENGYLKVSGTATDGYANITQEFNVTLSAGEYIFSITKPQTFAVAIRLNYTDNTTSNKTIPVGQTSINVTTTKEAKSCRAYIEGFSSGTTINSSFGVMLSTNGGDYEPYTGGEPAPNPNHKFPIKNTGDNVNEFDGEMELGTLGSSGQPQANNSTIRSRNFTEVKASTTYIINNDLNCSLFVLFYDENKTYLSINNTQNVPKTFETPENAKYIKIRTRETEAITDTNIKIKLEQGTQATPYSPYGCGNVNEKIENKNFLTNLVASANTTVTNGIVTQTSADTRSDLQWKLQTYNGTTKVEELPLIVKNTIGIFSRTFTKNSTFNRIRFGLNGSQKDTLVISDVSDLPDGEYKLVYNITNVTQGSISWQDVMITKPTETDLSYVPHAEQNPSFPLGEGQKFYEGSHPDDDEKVHHKMGEVVFDGVTTGRKVTAIQDYLGLHFCMVTELQRVGINGYNNLKCTHFIGREYTSNCIYMTGSGKTIVFVMPDQSINTPAKANNWLAEQYANGTPVRVVFELAEEQTEDFTEEQKEAWKQIKKARTYKNITHISSEDETPANVEIEYVVDINTIDDRITALEAKVDLLEE